MDSFKRKTQDEAETRELGKQIAQCLQAGDIVGLIGPLGAGKTTLAQGIARGLGLPENSYVNSPTFTIVREYDTNPRLYHYDLYRISDPDELYETGLQDIAQADGIALIEWIDSVPEAIPEQWLKIHFKLIDAGREITLTPYGDDWKLRLKSLLD